MVGVRRRLLVQVQRSVRITDSSDIRFGKAVRSKAMFNRGNRADVIYCKLGFRSAAGLGTAKNVLARRTLSGSTFFSSSIAAAASGCGQARK